MWSFAAYYNEIQDLWSVCASDHETQAFLSFAASYIEIQNLWFFDASHYEIILAEPANERQHLWSVAGYDYEIQDLSYPGASDY